MGPVATLRSLYAIGSATFLVCNAVVGAFLTEEVPLGETSLTSAHVEVSFPYVFAELHNVEASEPIIEHMVADTISDFNEDKPAFLYDDHQPNRLVLFYGDWCDTLIEFKPRFVKWAKNLQTKAEANGEFVMIYAVSCRPNQQLCLDQKVDGFPAARVLAKDSLIGYDLSYKELTFANVFEKLDFKFQVKQDENAWTINAGGTNEPSRKAFLPQISLGYLRYETSSISTTQRRRSLMNDIHLSLDFVLRFTLFTEKKALDSARKRHLNKFLKLLIRTLPEKWELQELLDDLLKNFNYATDSPSYMSLVLDRHQPQQNNWSQSCSKGEDGKGFSCGLWKLFHALSVGIVRYNTEVKEERRMSTKDAATTIRNFLEDHNRCVDCRDNILRSFDRCEYGRCHILSDATKGSTNNLVGPWAQLSIWLVQWHNGVNKMVLERRALAAGKNVTRTDQLNVLWPPRSECLPCWEKVEGNDLPKLNPTMTFNWLKAEYGPNDKEVRKAEQYILSVHRKEVRKENRPKRVIQISQSTLVILVIAAAWKSSNRKRVYSLKKQDDTSLTSAPDIATR